MTVAISGAKGFLGWHLKHHLKWLEGCNIIEIEREFFEETCARSSLKVEVFVHLAGVNRHEDQEFLYSENVRLAQVLSQKIQGGKLVTEKMIFTSSTHEKFDTPYGQSKREANRILRETCDSSGIAYTGLILPNIFGPFAKPNYNTVVATFCHNVANGIQSNVNDNSISLVYVGDVAQHITQLICDGPARLPITETSVTKVYDTIHKFHRLCQANEVPSLASDFDHNLYITYLASRPLTTLCRDIEMHADERGYFSELVVSNGMAQFSFSMSEVGISRGDHFHTYKSEIFFVLSGKANLHLRKIGHDEVITFSIDANKQPQLVHIPVWHTHCIENVGEDRMLCGFWISHPFRYDSGDTYFEKVKR